MTLPLVKPRAIVYQLMCEEQATTPKVSKQAVHLQVMADLEEKAGSFFFFCHRVAVQ